MLKDIVLKAHCWHFNTLHCFGDKHFQFFAVVAEHLHVQTNYSICRIFSGEDAKTIYGPLSNNLEH